MACIRLETPGEVRHQDKRCPCCGDMLKFRNPERRAWICRRGCAGLGKITAMSPYGQAWKKFQEGRTKVYIACKDSEAADRALQALVDRWMPNA